MTTASDHLSRNVATVGAATLLSRLLGFTRDLGVAAVLGAGTVSDAFFAALLIPNLFRRLLAEGALNSAFVPIWLRIRADRGSAATRAFGEEILGTTLAVLGLIGLACASLAPVLVHLTAPGFGVGDPRFALAAVDLRIALPYVAIAGVVAVAAAALNAEGRVVAASFGLIVFNVIAVAAVAALAFGKPWQNAGALLSAAVVLGGLAQLLVVGAAVLRLPTPPFRPRLIHSADARRFFSAALPGVIAAGIPQLKLMAGAMIASSSPSALSWLYYTYRLYELPLGVISVAIASVMAPRIAASLRADAPRVGAVQSRALEMALGLALPAATGLAILAHPIASGLFEHGAFGPHDAVAVAAALAAIAAGLPGHALEKVLGGVAFAYEDTRTPMFAALAGLAVAVAAGIILFPLLGHVGVAAGIAGSGWIGVGILAVVLRRRRWLHVDPDLLTRLLRLVLVVVAMAAVTVTARAGLDAVAGPAAGVPARLAILAALVAVALAVYLIGLELTGIARLRGLLAAVLRRPA